MEKSTKNGKIGAKMEFPLKTPYIGVFLGSKIGILQNPRGQRSEP